MAKQDDAAAALDAALAKRAKRGHVCKVGASPHRDIIEERLAKGVPIKSLEACLAEALGESISGESLTRHRDKVCLCAR